MTHRREAAFALLLGLPALALLAAMLVWPIVMTIATSLTVDDLVSPRRFVGLENYARLLDDPVARSTMGFTLAFVFVSTALEVAIGLLLALVMHHVVRGRAVVRAAVLVPWAIPTVVAAVLWKYMFNDQYGLVNLVLFGDDLSAYRAWLAEPLTARAAIVVADVWKTSAFAALILLAGLQAIPDELHEAARVDGASAPRRFFAITLPLLRPALLLALLFRVMDAFRVFDLVYVMTQGAPGDATNVLQFYGWQKMFPEQQFGYGAAVSVVVFLLVALVSTALVRVVGTRMFDA